MSASHLAIVTAHSQSRGITRLVAFSLANNYSPEVDYSLASVDIVCREANASVDEVERALRALIRLGEWSQVTIDGRRVMRLHMRCPIDCDRTALHRTRDGFEAFTPIRSAA